MKCPTSLSLGPSHRSTAARPVMKAAGSGEDPRGRVIKAATAGPWGSSRGPGWRCSCSTASWPTPRSGRSSELCYCQWLPPWRAKVSWRTQAGGERCLRGRKSILRLPPSAVPLTIRCRLKFRCLPRMSIKECTSGMDSETFHAYTVFFGNVHTICVFIQVRYCTMHPCCIAMI